jgi:hypothetical protein
MTLNPSRATLRLSLVAAAMAAAFCIAPVEAQTPQRPAGRGQTPQPARRPAPQRPAAPAPAAPSAPATATQKPAPPAPPPAPVPQDLRFKTVYTTGDQKTESVTFHKGLRQRFEFADMLLLKQNDLKRTVQISRAANSYLVVPDGGPASPPAPPAPAAAIPRPPGVVVVTSTFTDTGERKTVFGLQARHVKTTIERQPMPGACDPAKQRIDTDGWYVDMPVRAQPAPAFNPPAPAACVDEIKASHNGDVKALGFPISYSTTITGDDGKPNTVAMEVTELEVTTLDAALFEVPAGLTEAGDVRALSRALSDANEATLVKDMAAAAPSTPKTPGVLRIGVTEFTNKTTQQVDTRGLRAQLIGILKEAKLDAEPLPAMTQAELLQRSAERGNDFVLVAEVTELKASKGGGLGGMLSKAASVAGSGPTKEPTEAAISIKLLQPDGKTRLSNNAKGKDGGFDMKAGIGIAKFAGTMYMNMMTGRLMMNALSASMAGNMQGMGMLGNPSMFNMQAQGLGFPTGGLVPGIGSGGAEGMTMRGLDPTAGAASFLMQQAISIEGPTMPGEPSGPSFDAALDEALKNAAKAVSESVKKK